MRNHRELLIQKLHDRKDQGFTIGQISSQTFMFQPDQKEILELWSQAHKQDISEKWAPFVRFIFLNEEEKRSLSSRTARLLLDNRKSIKGFYEITRESTTFELPDRLSDFLKLRLVSNEYFEIYRKIMRRINFEYPPKEYSSKKVTGKINWHKTIQKSKTLFPLDFQIKTWQRQFNTPENILLLLVAYWLRNDCVKILRENLQDPLQTDEREILLKIVESINQIITRFPFKEILNSMRKYAYEQKNSEKISNLLSIVKKRISDGSIRNTQYSHLYGWVSKYNELDFEGTVQNKKKFIIKNIEDVDALYEVFIFLEFFNYLKNKALNPKLQKQSTQSSKYKIVFEIDGKTVEFFHGKGYSLSSNCAWALDATPDYSVEYENQIVAVFDAKNYQKYVPEKDTAKILDSIIHLNKAHRNLNRFNEKYPEIPKEIIDEYLELIVIDEQKAESFRKQKEEDARKENKKSKADLKKDGKRGPKEQILSYLVNLDVKYGGLIFPRFDVETKYSSSLQHETIHINELILETLRLDYHPKEMRSTRQSTMQSMWDVIEQRVKEVDESK